MRRRTVLFALALLLTACGQPATAAEGSARILLGAPTTLDPAAVSDAGSSAIIAQLFETLTAFDAERELQPAGVAGTVAMNGPAVWPRGFVATMVRSASADGTVPMWAA